ncbi:hypothetical protein C5750_04235 [Phyllobacterium myrsinacearum]|uniref:Uncharacterized protein n=1 Tax=Phyllobacterium myrsinacearum TaxID=28101 RepID=A0A2S9JYD0_9HYPH|nr:hypothetical protein C5750_04235 [Phyllobacterium myrsinacearum]
MRKKSGKCGLKIAKFPCFENLRLDPSQKPVRKQVARFARFVTYYVLVTILLNFDRGFRGFQVSGRT